jgi:betaine-aldehyde dehydrogenase
MTASAQALKPIFIGGEWRAGRGEPVASINPVDGSVNATFGGADAADVNEAVERGHAAMNEPAWRNLLPHERARILRRISDGLAAEAEALAQLQLRDNGKPIYETRGLVISASNTFAFYASALETLESEVTPSRGAFITMTTYQPLGVIGAITPWNSPIASEAQKVAPALAAGNAVVLKPSELSPLLALELARIAQAAGLPDGLLSVVPGTGAVAGAALVAHPLVKKISFTGGTTTGRAIARVAAEKLMPVTLELGGKSPTIVFADADMDVALSGVLYGIFSSQGQACIAGSRLFVQRSVYDAFVERLVARAKQLVVGDPLDPGTHLGPLISEPQRARVESYVELARAEGGRILCGGKRPAGEAYARGTFYEPTIIAGLTNDSRVCQEEIFGPVLVVMPFDDEADVIAQANDTVYGLACGIWTGSYQRAWRVGTAITAGTLWINTYKQFSISTPFAGAKASGIGVEKGRLGIRSYQQEQSIYWGLDERPNPWATIP